MTSIKWLRLLAYVVIGVVAINVFFVSYIQPLSFDDSYNLQIAKSLANNFVYQSSYFPRYIYDHRITTNGAMQYLGALNLKVFGDRIGLGLTLSIVVVFMLGSCLKYSVKTFSAAIVLLVSYPLFNELIATFLGEICALGFLLLGAHFTRKKLLTTEASSYRNIDLFEAMSYGLAISTKLVLVVILPFILIGLYCSAKRLEPKALIEAVLWTTVTYLWSVLVFVAFFYFSCLHSQVSLILFGRDASEFIVSEPGFWRFVKHHFWQQGALSNENMLNFHSYSRVWVLFLLIASAVLLVRVSIGWIPFVLLTLLMLAFGHMHERRLFLVIAPAFLLSVDRIFANFGEAKFSPFRLSSFARFVPDISVLIIWCYVLISGLHAGMPSSLMASRFDATKDKLFQWRANENSFVLRAQSMEVLKTLQQDTTPVVTSGWWQYPDLQLVLGRSFYDRMDSGVAVYLKQTPALLLFDPTNKSWPETSIEMCSEVLVSKPGIVLCRYKTGLPLNKRWGVD